MNTSRFAVAAIACAIAGTLPAESVSSPNRQSLAGTWYLHEEGNAVQLPMAMQVPGGVHSALLQADRIPDPYFGKNELRTQEVGRKDWCVERSFKLDPRLLKCASVILRLEDVDTFCTISVNDHVVGATDNRFRRWDFEVRQYLQPGDNRIVGVFKSAENESAARAKQYDHQFQISNVPWAKSIELIRKPQCTGLRKRRSFFKGLRILHTG